MMARAGAAPGPPAEDRGGLPTTGDLPTGVYRVRPSSQPIATQT